MTTTPTPPCSPAEAAAEMREAAAGTWREATAGIVRMLEVAGSFDQRAVFNADGAAALAKLLKEMARLLDDEVARRAVAADARYYAMSALNGFDDLADADAIENAKHDLRTLLRKLPLPAGDTLSTGGWRPIGTAPRDGTPILACCRGFQPAMVKWVAFDGLSKWSEDPETFMAEDHFRDYFFGTDYRPTHWQPLPPPPG